MMRQTFLKLAAFVGLGAPIPTRMAPIQAVRTKRDTSLPQAKVRRQTPHGKMRLFRSYQVSQ